MYKFLTKGLAFLLLLPLLSCLGDRGFKHEVFYLGEEAKKWLSNTEEEPEIFFEDNLGRKSSFLFSYTDHGYGGGSSGFLFVTTRSHEDEYIYHHFESGFGERFQLGLNFLWVEDGECINLNFKEVGLSYNLKNKDIEYISTGWDSRHTNIKSQAELLSDFTWGSVNYEKVLHFIINDTDQYPADFLVTDIYIAQGYGLIGYVLANEHFYYRLPKGG